MKPQTNKDRGYDTVLRDKEVWSNGGIIVSRGNQRYLEDNLLHSSTRISHEIPWN
jgi:hypothetical protein